MRLVNFAVVQAPVIVILDRAVEGVEASLALEEVDTEVCEEGEEIGEPQLLDAPFLAVSTPTAVTQGSESY